LEKLIDDLRDLLGPGGVLTGDDVAARIEGWGAGASRAAAIVRPDSTEQVSAVLKLCSAAGQSVVTHGGLTGIAGGAISTPDDIALSLERMNAIAEPDIGNRTLEVEAGAVLQTVQERVDAAGLLFPQDLGGRGSATIGGMVATNAGGNRVIRYGMMRDMVLGLEVVLADGTVVTSMNRMIKNNAGYDLKQMFIGSEGTLGVVTRVVLRLRSQPRSQSTALVACDDFDAVATLLASMERDLGGQLSSYEVLWDDYYRLSVKSANGGKAPPLDVGAPYTVLVESLGGDPEADPERFEQALGAAMEQGLIADAVIARSESDRDAIWAIRDNVECMHTIGPVFLFDISLPIGDMPDYLTALQAGLDRQWSENTLLVFGHLGDGNLHVTIAVGDGSDATRHAVEETVYSLLAPIGGSVTAEHGVGIEKREFLHYSRNPAELALMRTLKQALDPKGLLNPGKIFQAAP